MNEKKFIILIALATLLIMGGGVYFLTATSSGSAQVAASSRAKALVDQTDFDWGKINYDGPKATKVFNIKNTGTDTLKLFNIKTSCHCTKAHLTINGKDGPDFGMTGISSWVGEVNPGQEAKLTVVFDQQFHGPQGVGSVTRYISVETNDSSNSKITFTASGTVVKE
ncbi:DUF1573 domain-containing protein [Patescibacteria group bacterium]|nr:DUF1573 domain-containing protein [Patescibacteria group bacterium]